MVMVPRFGCGAPHADKVCVTGAFNDWSEPGNSLAKEAEGYWSLDVPQANVGDSDNDIAEGWGLMQWINEEIKKQWPDKICIAEDLRNNAFIIKNVREGSAGFDTQWDARFSNRIRETLLAPDEAARNPDLVREAIEHRFEGSTYNRVIYTESHDEVANGKARIPEEVSLGDADTWYAKKLSTLGAALVFTSPGIPMIFQGQEFLENDWFHDKDPIDWSKKRNIPRHPPAI